MTEIPPGKSTATFLEYAGIAGATVECVEAVERLLLNNVGLSSALILTNRKPTLADHALLLTIGESDELIVKSGFTSGYGGTGPRGFSAILSLLRWYDVEIDEVEVEEAVLERLDASALTIADLSNIKSSRRLRPQKFWDYIFEDDMPGDGANPWRHHKAYVPMPIIDDRLATAARDFWSDPDGILMKVHRQLEELVREKAGIAIEDASAGPAATFRLAFNGECPRLTWPQISKSEHVVRTNLFMGALNAYRHVRAHRAVARNAHDLLCELLLFNQLFRLEAEAVPVSPVQKNLSNEVPS